MLTYLFATKCANADVMAAKCANALLMAAKCANTHLVHVYMRPNIRKHQGQNSGGSRLVAGLESASNQPLPLESVAARVLKLPHASSRFLKQQAKPESLVTEIRQ